MGRAKDRDYTSYYVSKMGKEGRMIIIWILAIIAYFIINTIIAISWLIDNKYKHQKIVAIVLLFAGLPIMVIVVAFAIVFGVMEVLKHE